MKLLTPFSMKGIVALQHTRSSNTQFILGSITTESSSPPAFEERTDHMHKQGRTVLEPKDMAIIIYQYHRNMEDNIQKHNLEDKTPDSKLVLHKKD